MKMISNMILDLKIVIVLCDLISWFSDYDLYHHGETLYEQYFWRSTGFLASDIGKK